MLADGRLDGELEIGVTFLQLRHDLRQVGLEVPACTEKHRDHPQVARAFGIQRGRAICQRGLHQFEEGEHDALAGQQFAEFGYELLERPRPLRVARAMGEKDEGSLVHGAIICDAAAPR